jgi:acyl dehydratase
MFIVAESRPRGGRSQVGSDIALIGKTYPQATWAPSAARLDAFLAATDEAYAAVDGAEAQIPPMAVVLATVPFGAMQVASDMALIGDHNRLLRLLHSAEDISWRRPLRVQERFYVTACLAAVEVTAAGETLRVTTRLTCTPDAAADDWVVLAHSDLFIRERSRQPPRAKASPPPPTVTPAVIARHTDHWQVAADQAARYAAASGDSNPIHLDAAVAQRAGLKGCVVHGLCTMSFAQRAIVSGFAAGVANNLRRLAARFVRPVYAHDVLTFAGEALADGQVMFTVRNQHQQVVLAAGRAQVGIPVAP